MYSFVDTHAHLIRNVDWALMDKIAGSGILEQAWLMALKALKEWNDAERPRQSLRFRR